MSKDWKRGDSKSKQTMSDEIGIFSSECEKISYTSYYDAVYYQQMKSATAFVVYPCVRCNGYHVSLAGASDWLRKELLASVQAGGANVQFVRGHADFFSKKSRSESTYDVTHRLGRFRVLCKRERNKRKELTRIRLSIIGTAFSDE